ncbi:hypothetical protein FOZ63_028093 [Perkinsus olseni]|uniref:Uncharacterized protein n=1 Tax=Perkinsus olseni TaxID=32597 RepID=A0A7J6T8Z6_PEROL|nr:hypothetical protein FOZ63_028093 [Perkinsus olseni]
MMNFLPTWLVVIQVAIIAEAQHFGMFVHKASYYSITYEVNKNYEVTFGVNVTVEPSQWFPDAKSSSFQYGAYPLKRLSSNAFTVDFEGHKHSLRDWYMSMEKAMVDGGVIESHGNYPPIGMTDGDLTVLQYEGPDTLTVNFQDDAISFSRVSRSLAAGKFVYKDCMKPRLRLRYKVSSDSSVHIKAACDGKRISRATFKLVHRDGSANYQHYDVVPAGKGTLDEFRQQMRTTCRLRYVSANDFSRVTFAADGVILVRLGDVAVALVTK